MDLKGQTLNTLVHGKEFTILDVSPYAVKLRRSETRTTSYVERVELARTLSALTDRGALNIGDIREFSVRSSSYIAAIFTRLPGISWDGDGLRLETSAVSPRSATSDRRDPSVQGPADEPSFDTIWAQQSDDVLALWRKLNRRTQKDIIALTLADTAALVRNLGCCESPLEQVLSVHLLASEKTMSLIAEFNLETQHEVQTAEGVYRVDILVKGEVNGSPVVLAVECDGHEFHDRTKEQAARDRQRDRALKLVGYEVIRFAGSEIYDDPERCANEVFSQMIALGERRQSPAISPEEAGRQAVP